MHAVPHRWHIETRHACNSAASNERNQQVELGVGAQQQTYSALCQAAALTWPRERASRLQPRRVRLVQYSADGQRDLASAQLSRHLHSGHPKRTSTPSHSTELRVALQQQQTQRDPVENPRDLVQRAPPQQALRPMTLLLWRPCPKDRLRLKAHRFYDFYGISGSPLGCSAGFRPGSWRRCSPRQSGRRGDQSARQRLPHLRRGEELARHGGQIPPPRRPNSAAAVVNSAAAVANSAAAAGLRPRWRRCFTTTLPMG